MTQEAIGKFIAKCREEQKLSVAMLGGRLGVSDKKINSWEEGSSMPGSDMYEPLCRVLDIQVSELLSGKRLKDSDKIERGEKAAGAVLAIKPQFKIYNILAIALIIVGIVIAIMVWTFNVQFAEKIIPFLAGLAVSGVGIALFVLFKRAMIRLEKE